jgi:hypothetical protein
VSSRHRTRIEMHWTSNSKYIGLRAREARMHSVSDAKAATGQEWQVAVRKLSVCNAKRPEDRLGVATRSVPGQRLHQGSAA